MVYKEVGRVSSVSNPDREYGDIDLVFAYPVWATDGNTRENQNKSIKYYSDILVSLAGKLPYVDSDTAKSGGRNAIIKFGNDYAQVDFIKTTMDLKDWTKGRYAPEYGMKGFTVGNLFAALGDILRLSTGDRGIVAKLKQDEIVPFILRKDVKVVQVSKDFKNFFNDILDFLVDHLKMDKSKIEIHPEMKKHKGLNPNNVKLENLAAGISGLAKTFELNNMFGKVVPAKNAKDFMNQVYRNYQLKMASEYTRKVKKAQTEKQKEAIDKIKKSVQDGLKIVKNKLK